MSLSSRSWFRGLAATSAAVVFAVAGGAAALADDVSNSLDGSIDSVAEVMSLNVGGPNGTTTLYITPRNGDGKSGCNINGRTDTLTVSVTSSNTAVASVSPSSVTFSACGDAPSLTVTPLAQGSATVTVAQTSNTTDATFNFAPAIFTVVVAGPANTAPVIAVSGVVGGVGYEFGSVPAAVCSVSDAEDGPKQFTATLSAVTGPNASIGLGSQTASCSYTDTGGLTASSSVEYSIVDTTAPSVAVPANITAEATGPSGATATFTASATDAVSPLTQDATCTPASGTTFALGTTTVTCSATDTAGNTGSNTFTVTVQDTTAPAITWVGGPAADGSYVFGSVPAPASCTAVDLVDGDVDCTVTGYSASVGAHQLTAKATDDAGNTATKTRRYTVLAWALKGFYQPVDLGGVVNTVKAGSTVPLKFELFAGTTELTSPSAVSSFTAVKVSCASGAPEDSIETFSTTGGTSLRYDSTGGQFIQNWQTPKTAGACYVVTMTAADGSPISANFKLK
jgi:hypothetical protein